MRKVNNVHNFSMPHNKSYYGLSVILTLVLVFGIPSIFMFVPDFWFNDIIFHHNGTLSFFESFNAQYINNILAPTWQKVFGWLFWAFTLLTLILSSIVIWPVTRQLIAIVCYRKNYEAYLKGCEPIINSCDPSKFKDKVAMVVSTCNDILPSTILQTARQTYKNMDVWISDDSNKPEMIVKIDAFAKQHGFHVLHRDPEHKRQHPTKLGNLFYFLEKQGNNYDFIFENDSSSIITSTFVENCLCFFHSPLLDHSKDGGIICNGGFYGTKALLPFLYSKAWQVGESISFVGATVSLDGHPAPLNGWGAMYRVSTLKQIPIKDVECPSCDMARGLWLSSRGYKNYLQPFDLASKMCPQNIEAIKNQQLKWHGAEIFLFRNGVSMANIPDWKVNVYVKSFMLNVVIVIPFTTLVNILFTIIIACLNFFYLNLSAIILTVLGSVFLLIIFAIFLIVKKAPILPFIFFSIFFPLTFGAIIYRKLWQNVVRGFILKKWSSGAVTVKGVCKMTTKQKIRMGLMDYFIILLGLILCLVLTLCLSNAQLNRFIIWFNIFLLICGPSILYILWIWIGEIPVKVGWNHPDSDYDFWLNDFRYPIIKQTSIWKKKHK